MKRTVLTGAFLLAMAGPAAALNVCWDQVVNDPTGAPLASNLLPTSYKLWQCGSAVGSCNKTTGTVLTTVLPPFPTLPGQVCASITGQPTPTTYFATAVNIVTESAESNTAKATPADAPKNTKLQ